jgi:hypothetical protein
MISLRVEESTFRESWLERSQINCWRASALMA